MVRLTKCTHFISIKDTYRMEILFKMHVKEVVSKHGLQYPFFMIEMPDLLHEYSKIFMIISEHD